MVRLIAFVAALFVFINSAVAQITFERGTSHDFGRISGQEVSCSFPFVNRGDEPVVILGATASCDCIKIDTPRRPIMAGDSAQIVIKYRASRKDEGRFTKVVEVLTSGTPPRLLLTVMGEVENL